MALPFSDNFNRADGAVGANYTTVAGTPLVTSNTYGGSTANNSCYYNGDTPNADCYAQAKFNLPSGGSELLAVGVRFNPASVNGYYVQYQFGGGTKIIRIDAGAPTTLATLASDPTTGQVVRLEAQGNTLRVYYNGSLIGSATDGTYSTANRTFLVQSNSGQAGSLDDFETGNLSAVATLSAPTPSGTIGTTTTATIGATTDQTSGTFYAVVDTSANLSGVTASQIKAGQKASGSAALASGNSAVSTTTPSVGVTGLSGATAYAYAAVQNNSNGDSNVVTGTFTTATPTPVLEQTHYRFRNDDGSETTATWAAAEDTPISLAKNTPVRLRVEIGATNDPASAAYKLQYRKVGDSTWRDIN